MVRILVTGGSGFIGSNLVAYYKGSGLETRSIDILPPRNPDNADVHNRVDILDLPALKAFIDDYQPNILFHLAARTDLQGKSVQDYGANTTGVSNLLSVVSECSSLKRLVVASSRLVCRIGYKPNGDEDYCPTTPYGQSKVTTERIVRAARLSVPWSIVRPTSIWGPWFGAPYDLFFRMIARGLYVRPGNRRIMKSFGYVGNTVFELDQISRTNEPIDGKTFYLCDYPPIDVSIWAEMIREAMHAPKIRTVPFGLLKAAATAGDMLARLNVREPPLTTFRLNNLVSEMLHDTNIVERVAGTLPYTLQEGVALTADWIKGGPAG